MPTFKEIINTAKMAKEYVQKSSILNPLARGALKNIPVAGELLLEMWDQSAGSDEDKKEQILETLKTIENMNESTFENFKEKLNDNHDEILKNRDKLNQILFDTSQILDELKRAKEERMEITKKVTNVGVGVTTIDKNIQLNQQMIVQLVEQNRKIIEYFGIQNDVPWTVQDPIPNQQYEEIRKRDEQIAKLQAELKKQNKALELNSDYILKDANVSYHAKNFEEAKKRYGQILEKDSDNAVALKNNIKANANLVHQQDLHLFMDILMKAYERSNHEDFLYDLAVGYVKMGMKFEFLVQRAIEEAPPDRAKELQQNSSLAMLNLLNGKYTSEHDEINNESVVLFALQMLEQKGDYFQLLFHSAAKRILDLPKNHKLRDMELVRKSIWKFYETAKKKNASEAQLIAIDTILKEQLESKQRSLELIKEGEKIIKQISNNDIAKSFIETSRNYGQR